MGVGAMKSKIKCIQVLINGNKLHELHKRRYNVFRVRALQILSPWGWGWGVLAMKSKIKCIQVLINGNKLHELHEPKYNVFRVI